jgi:inner membrane protein
MDDEEPERLKDFMNGSSSAVEGKVSSGVETMTFLSGQVTIDSPQDLRIEQSAFGFAPIRNAGGFLVLDHAPIETAIATLTDQYITGSITIKQIEKR